MRRALLVGIVGLMGACGDASAPADGGPRLSETGLYRDFAARVVADDVVEYTPAYALWSDGADKRRWLRLPPGTTIDESDPDHWQFPIGTQLWKEFSQGGVLLETRLIERTGPEPMDYFMGSFVWTDDGTDAVLAEAGAQNIRGTGHDAPAAAECWSCHAGEPGRILGYSAVQLAGAAPAALGYLHANCGHCHSDTGIARPDTNLILRLSVGETTAETTALFRSIVGVPLDRFRDPVATLRIAPGQPDASGIYLRMRARGDDRQMPPLATERTDDDGSALVRAFIVALSPP